MKLISDSGCFRCCTKSTQLVYGLSPVADIIVIGHIVEFAPCLVDDGIPVPRPRARSRTGEDRAAYPVGCWRSASAR